MENGSRQNINSSTEQQPAMNPDQFSRCLSDPKLIVARHVFSDSDDFCKKTLDVSEQIAMIRNRTRLTLLFKVLSAWRGYAREEGQQFENQ